MAAADSQAKYFAFQTASLQSAYAVERSYYQLYFLEEKLRVDHENLVLLAGLAMGAGGAVGSTQYTRQPRLNVA